MIVYRHCRLYSIIQQFHVISELSSRTLRCFWGVSDFWTYYSTNTRRIMPLSRYFFAKTNSKSRKPCGIKFLRTQANVVVVDQSPQRVELASFICFRISPDSVRLCNVGSCYSGNFMRPARGRFTSTTKVYSSVTSLRTECSSFE